MILKHSISTTAKDFKNQKCWFIFGLCIFARLYKLCNTYLNLPAIGWDQNSRSGKGYTQGLFRGANLITFETEYRFPIMKNQLISGTVFANATSASDVEGNLNLFHTFQPAIGVGLRILLDKNTLTNFVMNFGLGRDSKTFYFNDGEGF